MSRLRGVLLTVVLTSAVFSPLFAQQHSMNAWAGQWRRNVARSTYSPGPPPTSEQTLTLEIVNGLLRVTEEGFNALGQPTRTVVTVTFDGTEQTVDTAQGLTRSYRWIDERKYEGINRVKGEETTVVEYALAADGKTQTLTTTGISSQGQLVHHVVVYEKQ